MTIRVAVVDDQDVVRSGFAALLATQEDLEVVGRRATAPPRSSSVVSTARTSS